MAENAGKPHCLLRQAKETTEKEKGKENMCACKRCMHQPWMLDRENEENNLWVKAFQQRAWALGIDEEPPASSTQAL